MKYIKCTNALVKFEHAEKHSQFEKIFHFKFDASEKGHIFSGRFFKILCASQNVQTLKREKFLSLHKSIIGLIQY